MKIGRIEIKASRWPWQEDLGWFPHKSGSGPKAPLNPMGARFGGGWQYKLGIAVGGSTVIIDLLFGSIRIQPVRD